MKRLRARLWSGIGLVVLVSLRTPAHAAEAPQSTSFSWQRGEGAEACPSADELRALVRELAGHDPFARGAAFTFEGEVRREADELVATLRTASAVEPEVRSRSLRADAGDCASLGRAVALALALAAEHAEPPPPAAPPPEPQRPPPRPLRARAAAPLHDDAAERPAAAAHDLGRVAIVPHARWSLGALPRPTAGLGVALRARPSTRLSSLLGGEWLPSASARGQFSLSLLAARAGACFDVLPGAVRVAACGHAAAGVLQVRGEAADVRPAGSHPWFAAGLGAVASTRLGSSWVGEAGVEGGFPFKRPIFQGNNCPPLGFQQPVATLSVFIGAGPQFF